MNLEEAIAQLIELGETDPIVMSRKIEAAHGRKWMADQLYAYAEDIVSSMCRDRFGASRRKAEVAIKPGDPITSGEMKIQKIWITGQGHKRVSDITVEDLETRAAMYGRLMRGMGYRAEWCLEVAQMMREEGVKTLGKLKATLPVLPVDTDIRELVAA